MQSGSKQFLLASLILAASATMAVAGPPSATVKAHFPNAGVGGEDGITNGTQLTLRVEVENNTSGFAPSACAFRIYFDNSIVTWNSVVSDTGDGELGVAVASPADETDTHVPPNFRDVATVGPTTFPTTELNPICFDVIFDVGPNAATMIPYSFEVAQDPGPSIGNPAIALPYITVVPPAIGAVTPIYDNSAAIVSSTTSIEDWTLLD